MDIDSNKIKKIKKDYLSGYTYKQIAEKHNITSNNLKWLIKDNKWTRPSNRKKALKGNSNAKGNKSKTQFKNGNKAALTTGEFETLDQKYFDKDELAILESDVDAKTEIEKQIKILTIREYRILGRIDKLKKGNDLSISYMSKSKGHNDEFGYFEEVKTQAEDTTLKIQKLEDSLTRVQEAKRRAIDSLQKYQYITQSSREKKEVDEKEENKPLSLLESINRQLLMRDK